VAEGGRVCGMPELVGTGLNRTPGMITNSETCHQEKVPFQGGRRKTEHAIRWVEPKAGFGRWMSVKKGNEKDGYS